MAAPDKATEAMQDLERARDDAKNVERQTVEQAAERVAQLDRDIGERVESFSLAPLVKSLQALRGVQLVTAVVMAAELATGRDSSRRRS